MCLSLRRISELFRRFFWPHGSLRCSDVRYEPVCALFRQVHGEWGGPANGELDDLSLRFPNIEFYCLEGVYLLWHMTTATLPGICNTVRLISFQSRNKTKPNLFFPPHHISHQKQLLPILESMLRFPSKVLLKLPYFPKHHTPRDALKCKYSISRVISRQYENNQSDIMCCILTLSFSRRL